jgi:hypothetical protein
MVILTANKHLTLGEFIEELEELPSSTKVQRLEYICSYRGYYKRAAFVLGYSNETSSPEELIYMCKDAIGKTYTDYKGWEFIVTKNTFVYVVTESDECGWELCGISQSGELIVSEY